MVRALKNIIIFLIALISSAGVSILADETTPFVVVIDPGHGGKDSGCVGTLTKEKTIVLDVSKRLQSLISDCLPEVKIVMTRDNDKYLTLQDRAVIANNANGNLFISVHVNSVDKRNRRRQTIHGASVYTLGLSRSESNLSVAMRENSVMELEDDYSQTYQGFDPKSAESYIIFELNQNTHINHSIEFANAVQKELISTAGRADKDVRQDGFWVLWATSMPSVLIELDYICNPDSEKFMNSEKGKDKLAKAIYNAFVSYYSHHKKDAHGPRVGKAVPSLKSMTEADEKAGNKSEASQKSSPAPLKGFTYHVQILSARKTIPEGDHEIKGVPNVNFIKDGKFYKYYSGSFKSQDEAKKHLSKMKKRFPKAFIIKMRDGKPI